MRCLKLLRPLLRSLWVTLAGVCSLAGALPAQDAVSIHQIMVASPGITGYTSYFLPDSLYLCSHEKPDRNAEPAYPGTYTVTATDGTITHSATYSLVVTAKQGAPCVRILPWLSR